VNHRHTAATTPTTRTSNARRAGLLGLSAAAILGIAAGPAAAAHAPTPVPLPASAVTTAYPQDTPTTGNASQPAHTAISLTKPAGHTVAKAKAPAHKKTAKVKVPSMRTLLPHGVAAGQQRFALSAGQRANAAAIVKAGKLMHLPPRAMVLAVQCAMQESTLHNYGNLGARNDHDSQGLFQQRPSSGWGTPAQVTNPVHAAQSFLHRLIQVPGWQHMPATLAIQQVQVSAFPMAYAKWEKFAASVVAATYAADAAKQAAQATK